MSDFELVRVEKPNFGFAMHIPADWVEATPLDRGTLEVTRFGKYFGTSGSGVIVNREPRRWGNFRRDWAANTTTELTVRGCDNFSRGDCVIAGEPAEWLEYTMHNAGYESDTVVRHYLVVTSRGGFQIMFSATGQPGDRAFWEAAASKIELFEPITQTSMPESVFAIWLPRARQSFENARRLAGEQSAPVGADHLLVGMAKLGQGIAFEVLQSVGVSADALERALVKSPKKLHDGSSSVTPTTYRLAGTTAPDLAARLVNNYIGTEHLLLGILADEADPDGAVALIEAAGSSRKAVRDALADWWVRGINYIVRGPGLN